MEKDEWPEKKDSLKKMQEKELVNNSSIQKVWILEDMYKVKITADAA